MTKSQLEKEAYRFRQAIEDAKEAGEFKSNKYRFERMNRFPHDCCDDAADLFTHYLFIKYNVDSIRVDGEYYDKKHGRCAHSWQVTDGLLIDLTGDQFEADASIPIKANAVYVGAMDAFHRQFQIFRKERSCGIECLGNGSHERMYGLYDSIIKYIH